MLTWHYVTRAQYDAADASTKTSDKLYFLSDTHEIYRGTELFTESVTLYTDEPATKAVGRLYVNASTLEGKIWSGSAWTTVIQPVQATLTASDTSKPVSGKAVSDYVTEKIAEVTGSNTLVSGVAYVADTNSLTVTKADSSSETIPMTNVAADLVYDAKSGKLQVKSATGTALGTGVMLDLERFVKAASYDHGTHKITLAFDNADIAQAQDKIEIDVGDLIDTYTAKSSTTVSMTVTGNEFTAEAIVASGDGYTDNLLVKTDKGLYVAAVDQSAKADKVTDATANNLAALTVDGNLKDSGVAVGGSTLSVDASASVLATEAAVAAVRAALTAEINKKMNKVGAGHDGEIVTANSEGDAVASGVSIGGETLAADPNGSTVATEAAVVAYTTGYAVAKTSVVAAGDMSATVAAASNEKVASEKAVVDCLTWKTTV